MGESFMELFCIFPIVNVIMMRHGFFDDEGVVHTMGVPGEMLVSMVFTDEVDEESGKTSWFNKRERFKNMFMKRKMWDKVCNFGFHTLPDGRIECYHHGEYFVGNLPIVSLAMKTIFQVHARWVAWATEHHINHHAFTAETEEDEDEEEDTEEAKDEVEEEKVITQVLRRQSTMRQRRPAIPIKRQDTMLRITKDIAMDRAALQHKNTMLVRINKDVSTSPKEMMSLDDIAMDPEKTKGMGAYEMATKAAIQRHQTLRVARRRSSIRRFSPEEVPIPIEPVAV